MILKVSDTDKLNISMTLHIDDEAEEITVHIKHWNKQTGVINGYEYSAAEYSKALSKFKELENIKIDGKTMYMNSKEKNKMKDLCWNDLTTNEKIQATETYLSIREAECEYSRDTPEFLEENPSGADGVKNCSFERENDGYIAVLI